MALWLVLDTAAPEATVGVVDVAAGVVVSEVSLRETKRHAERLPSAVEEAMQGSVVVGVGVGLGPGSFIGVRTAIAFAKGLCRARGVPLIGIPSLWALASSVRLPEGGSCVAALDAKRGERYAQVFHSSERGLDPEGEPVAMAPELVAGLGGPDCVVVGVDGAAGFVLAGPSALGMMRVLRRLLQRAPADERVTLAPLYVRAPDAKLPALDPARHRPTNVS
ncbi:MAG: tRNA (adenosine(37)-N6)-threonylcarbamoyltransferase complex dimerization subunit type 1 TsaB [Deltaproteobacteria bacterium]|nr:tRNA (adenosine(37)-N6)-threonylcarbamoyltransferase complex dimerization subunit type 1 TsaB [Deltaproteobacteria bacterium]